jgi:hypothetical protein
MTVSIIGDIHGQLEPLHILLRSAALVDHQYDWDAGSTHLWFIGDFFDRGPDGIGVLTFIMQLQKQAQRVGGQVSALLGNHDVLLLAAQRFGQQASTGPGGTFYEDWKCNGGVEQDLSLLSAEQIEWLIHLPALARVGGAILAHADASFYTSYGRTIEDVNTTFFQLLQSFDPKRWDTLLDQFSERDAFLNDSQALANFLDIFGGQQLVHGHTPISRVTGQPPATVDTAFVYAQGRCINVDGGIYLGGPGFIYSLAETRA